MKKTLTLLSLLCSIVPNTLAANEVIWTAGVDEKDTSTYYTAYKHNPSTGWDHNMCWAAAASNVIAWWQDQVTKSGAYILPENCPTGLGVWEEVRLMWQDNAGYAVRVMQHWLSGDRSASNDSKFTDKGLAFTGYFNHLLGADYAFNGDPRPDNCMTTTVYANARYASASYDVAVPQIVELMRDGWGMALGTTNHAMTMYAIEVDENDDIVKVWYSDNNYDHGAGYLQTSTVRKGNDNQFGQNAIIASTLGYGGAIENVYAMRSTGMQFDTYEAVAGEDNKADVFSHFLNLTINGASDYSLKYDMRVAGTDCPVDTQGKEVGNIRLQNGKLSLVAGEKEFDGGGKTNGTLSFEAISAGTERTLSVNHTATIAKEIKIAAADGNTLEVAAGHKASFGTLSGTGDLDKTGAGSAEVTEAVTLMGEIRVHEGSFIFGTDATITGDTSLSISSNGQVLGAEDKGITLTINSGVHVNNGELALTTTVAGGTLKGSGTFAAVTVDGGTLIVGNSPGHQDYEGALTLNSGKLVFCVSGFEEASEGENTGWASGTYSTINMRGNEFVVNENGEIVIALSGDAANSLTTANGTLALTLATDLKSGAFTEEQLAALAEQTSFELSLEDGAGTKGIPELNAPQFSYKMVDNALVLTTGISGTTPAVPEPATGTLSLLALAGLASRRRRK